MKKRRRNKAKNSVFLDSLSISSHRINSEITKFLLLFSFSFRFSFLYLFSVLSLIFLLGFILSEDLEVCFILLTNSETAKSILTLFFHRKKNKNLHLR